MRSPSSAQTRSIEHASIPSDGQHRCPSAAAGSTPVQSIALKSGAGDESDETPASVAPRPPERFDPHEAQMTLMSEIAQTRIASETEGVSRKRGRSATLPAAYSQARTTCAARGSHQRRRHRYTSQCTPEYRRSPLCRSSSTRAPSYNRSALASIHRRAHRRRRLRRHHRYSYRACQNRNLALRTRTRRTFCLRCMFGCPHFRSGTGTLSWSRECTSATGCPGKSSRTRPPEKPESGVLKWSWFTLAHMKPPNQPTNIAAKRLGLVAVRQRVRCSGYCYLSAAILVGRQKGQT